MFKQFDQKFETSQLFQIVWLWICASSLSLINSFNFKHLYNYLTILVRQKLSLRASISQNLIAYFRYMVCIFFRLISINSIKLSIFWKWLTRYCKPCLTSVTLGCGSTSSQNCTYFQSSATNQPAGQCAIKICKCSSDICQVHFTFLVW